MSRHRYLYYKGQYYDVGTRVMLKTRWCGVVLATFQGYGEYDGKGAYSLSGGPNPDDYIIEIVEPVYYVEPEPTSPKKSSIFTRTGSGSWGSSDEVFVGLVLYIAVMLVATIFKDRIGIWILATIVYFNWLKKK